MRILIAITVAALAALMVWAYLDILIGSLSFDEYTRYQ